MVLVSKIREQPGIFSMSKPDPVLCWLAKIVPMGPVRQ
ncbi:hypothetical protein DSOL_2984 [Desulfosporosinus metallidurans]|uniref:Uncharacterized protein n=1 Tax=Desulfosporosinus metallidurans TaxID=1888891 RepID=A0A1Q8QTK8_9FIRM|nr:hypothetical protein DSOL_2984 [Desulfosporosinus metallidurans]